MVLVNFPSRNIFGIIHKIYIVNVGHPDDNIIIQADDKPTVQAAMVKQNI
jgi:hypothetical protein